MEMLTRIYNLLSDGSLIPKFNKAISWIRHYSIDGGGVAVSSKNLLPYPEVTGYFIPTLVTWGERELACSYARWLVSIQNRDGSWSDPDGHIPYTFDTGQILKGLVALLDTLPGLETPVRKGCDWLLTQVLDSGRVVTPDTSQWVLPGNRIVPEAIHLYALAPLREAGERFGNRNYIDAVAKGLDYYTADPDLTSFTTLSHFHAYVIEALIDLGRTDIAADGMKEIGRLQKRSGSVPAYSTVRWVCSTGLFQYALIWYRLGDVRKGDRAFAAAARLQNASGGFFGSYGWGASYFPRAEISWAVKYFLDAFNWKIRAGFDNDATIFPDSISENDGRYRLVADVAKTIRATRIMEAGCGKGRFLQQLDKDFPSSRLAGLDLSLLMLSSLPASVTPLLGSLLNIPCPDKAYDYVYCVEALEHAVNVTGAVRELCRVVAPGGALLIIDKNHERKGSLKIADWEQWFTLHEVTHLLTEHGFSVEECCNIPYDGNDGSDGLFIGWIARRL